MDLQILAAPDNTPGGVDTALAFRAKADDTNCGVGSSCAWKDNSPNANDIEVVGTVNLQAANPAHNFQPYFASFSNANYFKDSDSSIATSTSYYTQDKTIFTVVQPTTASANGHIAGIDNANTDARYPGVRIYGGKQYFIANTNNNQSTNVVPVNASSVLAWKTDGTLVTQRMNANVTSATVTNGNRIRGNEFQIGYGDNGNGNSPFPGAIQEVIWYNTALSATEIQKVESYLALKYGVSLTAGDYLASDGSTTMWNASTAGAYTSDIAGIGRDDASALNQKQSKSADDILTVGLGSIAVSNVANNNTFSNNFSFLSRSSNGGDSAWTVDNAPTSRWILKRTWKMQATNIITPTLAIRVPDYVANAYTLPPSVNNTIYLLLDDDGDFSAGTTEIPLTLNGAYREGTMSFDPATPYLTFATVKNGNPG